MEEFVVSQRSKVEGRQIELQTETTLNVPLSSAYGYFSFTMGLSNNQPLKSV